MKVECDTRIFISVNCSLFRPRRLVGYADDIVEIGRELELEGAIFVGHSLSAMIGALAVLKAPGTCSERGMVGLLTGSEIGLQRCRTW